MLVECMETMVGKYLKQFVITFSKCVKTFRTFQKFFRTFEENIKENVVQLVLRNVLKISLQVFHKTLLKGSDNML